MLLAAYGRTVEVQGPESLLAEAFKRLPPTYVEGGKEPERVWRLEEQPHEWVVFADGEALASAPEPLAASGLLLSDVELWVAAHADNRIFVHAGCVMWHDLAVVLPGRTMSGKTSLTAALVRAGAEYFSDEYAVLRGDGWVEPYARSLSVRPYDGTPPRRVRVEELGGRVGASARPVGMIARLTYRPGTPSIRTVTPAVGALHLLDNTVPAQSRPRDSLDAVTRAAADAVAFEGKRGDADAAAEVLLSHCSCQLCHPK